MHVTSERLVFAIASTSGAAALQQGDFTVDLRSHVEDTAAFLLRDNRPLPPAEARPDAEAALRVTAVFGHVADEQAAAAAPPVFGWGLPPAPSLRRSATASLPRRRSPQSARL
ncbi:hypothetical protein ACFVZN_20395 [Streptomyces virginiae]|uniref:hypothetical protein n=1 Tax=Streptomyces virginiae TaxID=1961 RepID=UPI0036A6E5AD